MEGRLRRQCFIDQRDVNGNASSVQIIVIPKNSS